ncbi:hypothetical protein EIN_247140 [Entamoeba invadens IP1]|uniref:Uncharacterized protein n=1 Tax=Entamoeba invadens IP1 TaxID=370355 RepID=A0A0A1UDZ9_ENTIV|nr:hypothetical protein EIN_247140 [Entamoeba invadens IP1]ELP94820.1 hypothetical protein EIN_247140 [Entamoeba invadens IP1]|eukprot:XP_004261591.1 hypothetical protein EIN_247140 [Entamoeba invadens IP1]
MFKGNRCWGKRIGLYLSTNETTKFRMNKFTSAELIHEKINLHHAESNDRSKPVISQEVHLKQAPKDLFADLKMQHEYLKPVQTEDKSVPVIPKNPSILFTNQHQKLMKEIRRDE